jgi:hypothetical protein
MKIRRLLSLNPRDLLLREIRRRDFRSRRGTAFRHRAVRDDQSAAAEHEKRKDKCFQKEKAPLVIPAAA